MATNEYDYINNALKTDLPRFMTLSTQFIDPLFNSFFYMQYVSHSDFPLTIFTTVWKVEYILPHPRKDE